MVPNDAGYRPPPPRLPHSAARSSFADGCDGDGGDEGFQAVEASVAAGHGADREQVAIAKVLGEAGELPAQNHDVGRGESQGEFVRREKVSVPTIVEFF